MPNSSLFSGPLTERAPSFRAVAGPSADRSPSAIRITLKTADSTLLALHDVECHRFHLLDGGEVSNLFLLRLSSSGSLSHRHVEVPVLGQRGQVDTHSFATSVTERPSFTAPESARRMAS